MSIAALAWVTDHQVTTTEMHVELPVVLERSTYLLFYIGSIGLSEESKQMGIKMHIAKTKVMVVDKPAIIVVEMLKDTYSRQHYSLKEKNQDKEIKRRIVAGCATCGKRRDLFNGNIAICLKRQVYNSFVLPLMTYGAQIWSLTKPHGTNLRPHRSK